MASRKSTKVLAAMMVSTGLAAAAPMTTAHASCAAKTECACAAKCGACAAKCGACAAKCGACAAKCGACASKCAAKC